MPTRQTDKTNRPAKDIRDRWSLQDAKARLSELVREARSHGPQHVTVHDRDSVVVISKEEYQRLKEERPLNRNKGQLLVDLLASSPLKDVAFERSPVKGPVRDVEL